MSPDDRMAEARALARRFAATLEDYRTRHGMEYIGARSSIPALLSSRTQVGRHVEHHVEHSPAPPSEPQPPPRTNDAPPSGLRTQAEQWSPAQKLEYLRQRNLGDCRRCPLCQSRRNIVFGVGNPEARLMFVGEAPGADEDARGEPFVGRAGLRLNQWIQAIGLRREDVYIANVLKCRPPNNRDPRPEEVDKCSPFLKAQIRAIAPRVIVALGRHAGMLLSGREDMSLRAMRMARLTYDASAANEPAGTRQTPLIVTYHPAYVLRQEGQGGNANSSTANDVVMEDLRRAVQIAQEK